MFYIICWISGVILFEMWLSLREIRQRQENCQLASYTDENNQFVDTSDAKLSKISHDSVEILKYSFPDSQEALMLEIMQNYYSQ